MLAAIDTYLFHVGHWSDCDTHHRYLHSSPVTIIGSLPRVTPASCRGIHLSTFSMGSIPGEISTHNLQRPKPKIWGRSKVSYIDIAKGMASEFGMQTSLNVNNTTLQNNDGTSQLSDINVETTASLVTPPIPHLSS
jgi:hypothetical protein